MNKDNLKGKMNDVKGRVERQAGEWTDDEKLQGQGAMDQAKGKVQNAWGNVKEGAKDVKDDVTGKKDEVSGKKDANREEGDDIGNRKDRVA
jgi:uncharacterized protein YjbJ (UPF0337 family)